MADYTAEQIQALRDAIASGILTVRHGDKQTTFRSLAEMREALAIMESSLTAPTIRPRGTLCRCSRGY